jgi:hypothetical protein
LEDLLNETTEYPEVNRQYIYHIVPFAYNKNYNTAVEFIPSLKSINNKDKEFNHWISIDISNVQFFHHIKELISVEKTNTTIGQRYELKSHSFIRTLYGLPPKEKHPMKLTVKNTWEGYIRIINVELYLFETQVGFLCLNVEFGDIQTNDKGVQFIQASAEQIVKGNYYLKRYNQNNITLSFEQKVAVEKTLQKDGPTFKIEHNETTMTDITCRLLKDLEVETYFTNKSSPHNATVFSSVTFNNRFSENDLYKLIFELSHAFKNSYKGNVEEAKNSSVRSFENIYWFSALEGIANIAYFTGDKITDTFLEGTFFGNIKYTYLTMYIIALHRRYALLYYTMLASNFSSNINDFTNNTANGKDNYLLVNELRNKIAFFKLRCVYSDLTNISHQAKLNDDIEASLRVYKLMKELEDEVEAILALVKLKEEKDHEDEMVIKESFNSSLAFITGLISILAFLQCFEPIKSIAQNLYYHGVLSTDAFILLVLIVVISIIFYKSLKTRRELRKLRSKL